MPVSVVYNAEPTASMFHGDDDFVRSMMGPIGSGKSVACVCEVFNRAMCQAPFNGVRRSRWAICRNTFPELKSTTIKTCEDWWPREICTWRYGSPIEAFLEFPLPDGTRVELEVNFIALDSYQDVKKLKSLELTGGWMNEASEMSRAVLDMLTGRVGRYPAKKDGGPSWSGIILDSNPPDDDSWYYKLFEIEKPKGYKHYKQPPALLKTGKGYVPNPAAENIQNHALGYDYYLRQVPGKDDDWIKVFIMGEYGSVEDGKPVFPEFSESLHVGDDSLSPVTGLPLIIGMDFGLDPCAVISQVTPRGQLLILDELVSKGMGVRQFIDTIFKPHIQNFYKGHTLQIYGDPAGNQRSQANERTCFEELKAAGFDAKAASSNNAFIARREAVAGFLNRLTDGKPGFVLHPKCDYLRKALRGRYKYERVKTANDERYKNVPVKNHYSHISDALQYLCLAIDKGRKRSRATGVRTGKQYRPASSIAGY